MNALSCAARRGIPLEGLTLYCTTFPCHLCARHLLSAGLSEVVYIEPYPKSLAVDLYDEAIVLGGSRQPNRLVFRPFTGVSPTRFLDFFDYGKRKDTFGFAEKWEPKNACPRTRQAGNPHLLVEEALCVKLHQALEVRNLV